MATFEVYTMFAYVSPPNACADKTWRKGPTHSPQTKWQDEEHLSFGIWYVLC